MLDLEPSFRTNNINNFEEQVPNNARGERNSYLFTTKLLFPQTPSNTFDDSLSSSGEIISSPPSQKQHTFSLKLKSIHRQSRRPFHSNILKLSFPFKPKGDSRPLRRSTPEFSCVCRLHPLPPPSPPHHHPPSCTRRKTHERTRPSENRLAARISGCRPFSKGHTKGLRNASVREGPLATDASHPPPPPSTAPSPQKESSAARSFARFTRDCAQSRGEERQGGQGSKQ